MKGKKPETPHMPPDPESLFQLLGKKGFGYFTEQIMNPKQAAAHLQVSLRTLYKLLRTREIPARKVGGQWRIARSRLDEYIWRGEG